MVLGLVLGLERVYAHKIAGMRTYALVTVASTAFVAVSLFIGQSFGQFSNAFNPAFMSGYIILGIGFLGAGLIMHRDGHVENLTTAAGIWACACLGIMIGFGMFKESLFLAFLLFFVMGVLSFVERAVRLWFFPDPTFVASEAALRKPRPSRKRVVKAAQDEE